MEWSEIERDLTEHQAAEQARAAEHERRRAEAVRAGRETAQHQVDRFVDRMTASGSPGLVRLVPPELADRMYDRTRSVRTSQPEELTLWERLRAARYERAGRSGSEPGWVVGPIEYTVDGDEARTRTLAVGQRGWIGCADERAVTLRRGRTIPDLYAVTSLGLPDDLASTIDSDRLARALVQTMWANGVSVN